MRRLDSILATWAAMALICVMVGGAVLVLRAYDSRPVVDYGTSPRSWFVPARAVKGQKIEQCFAEINWHRPTCPGEFHWSWRTPRGAIKTGEPHKISNPPGDQPRQLLDKCRKFTVPDFAEPGPNAMVDTYAASKCSWWHEWSPIRATGPTDIALEVEP